MLPQAFKNRMKRIAPDEADALFSALENEEPCRALRVNLTKTTVEKFRKTFPQKLEALSFCDDGFLLSDAEGIGRRPEHHAGAIYLQDPGAMSTLNAVKLSHGWRCADLCAAPGGKSSQISSAIGDDGFLLANEYVPKRAKILVGNIERLGLKNTVVTSKDTEELAALYPESFDFVLADVPCSGEGMFRKNELAVSEWSEENVMKCALRGSRILDAAAKMTAPGGLLLYSTCTFSLEENEGQVAAFLSRHPEFSVTPAEERVRRVTLPGIDTDGTHFPGVEECRRYYPHRAPGEGQFFALLQKAGEKVTRPRPSAKDPTRPIGKAEQQIITAFFREQMVPGFDAGVRLSGDRLIIPPAGLPLPSGQVFSAGVLLGELRKGILFPSHHFFSAFGREFLRKMDFPADDPRTARYLHGDELAAEGIPDGYCAVLCGGVPLGGGKVSGGMLKNHYPKGLRNP